MREMIADFERFRELVDHCIDESIQIAVRKFQLQRESPNPCPKIPDRGQRLAPLQTSRSTVNREMRPLQLLVGISFLDRQPLPVRCERKFR